MKTIRLWTLPNSGFGTVPGLRETLREFHRARKDIRVEVVAKTRPSMWKSVFNLIKKRESVERPELIQFPHTWTAALGQLAILEDLREVEPGLALDAVLPKLRRHCRGDYPVDASSQDGPIFSLPWFLELTVLYYRRDALKKAKLDPATALDEWPSFEETCGVLARSWAKRSGFSPIANNNRRDGVGLRDVAPWIWSGGGRLFSRDHSRTFFQREEALRGVAAYLGMLRKGWMPLSGQAGLGSSNLFDGYCALQFSGRYPRLSQSSQRRRTARRGGADLDWTRVGLTGVPEGPNGATPLLHANHLGMLRGAAHAREAWEVLRYLTDPERALKYSERIGALPPHEATFDRAFGERDADRAVFRRALDQAKTLPNLFILGTLEGIVDKTFENVVRSILNRTYTDEFLRQEMLHAATETDYILSLYGS